MLELIHFGRWLDDDCTCEVEVDEEWRMLLLVALVACWTVVVRVVGMVVGTVTKFVKVEII